MSTQIVFVDSQHLFSQHTRQQIEQSGFDALYIDQNCFLEALNDKAFTPDTVLINGVKDAEKAAHIGKQFHELARFRHTPLVLITNRETDRDTVDRYSNGITDFLILPADDFVITTRLKHYQQVKQNRDRLHNDLNTASKTAFNAMRGSSDLGMALNFIEQVYSAEHYDTVAQQFFHVMKYLELTCSLLFVTPNDTLVVSSDGNPSDDEIAFINATFKKQKRFNDFDEQSQINYSHVALFVKNMPVHDIESYGRYKDFLPSMLSATNVKIKSFHATQQAITYTDNLTQSYADIRTTLESLSHDLRQYHDDVELQLSDLRDSTTARAKSLKLQDTAIDALTDHLGSRVATAQKTLQQADSTQQALLTLNRLIQHLSEQQQALTGSRSPFERLEGSISTSNNSSTRHELF